MENCGAVPGLASGTALTPTSGIHTACRSLSVRLRQRGRERTDEVSREKTYVYPFNLICASGV